jgi:predicted helicase
MLTAYLNQLKDIKSRNGSEYSYRPALKSILKGLVFTDEPTGKGKNKIDMEVYTQNSLVAFYIETKNLNEDLSHPKHQDQFNRYKQAFPKLLITNFIDFEFYQDGNLLDKCTLSDALSFDKFNTLLDNFMASTIQFNSPLALAKKLADKTKSLKSEILSTLNTDDLEIEQKIKTKKKYKLVAYRNEFKKMLIEDIDNNQFADLYAQTLTYGLFASRYYAYQKDPNAIFTRSDASNLIPNTNPLLKQFFDTISNDKNELSQSINNLIDAITVILANTDMSKIISSLKLANNDIVIHFYENFLEQYDPELRKQMGVWYTPVEVVNYIVKGVDELLKTKFAIKDGISSSEKQSYTYTKKVKVGKDSYKTETCIKDNVHKVQILDPATGTGNFLNSVVEYIKTNYKYSSLWNDYVNKDLIPRLNGFELMMPSYVMAHMKMYELLKDSLTEDTDRFNIYLTNTLNGAVDVEEHLLSVSDLVYQLNEEAIGANRVRQEQPVMVVLGNPPYNGNSKNNGTFITELMSEYAQKGKNIGKGLNDDYIKFIRYGQSLIDQNQSGILAYISNNSFIKSLACSKMRESLLGSFDEIYILNLHGDKDENIFSITTPVCISFFVKTNKKAVGKLGKVFYHEIKGLKSDKISYCTNQVLNEDFKEIEIIGDEKYFYSQDVTIFNQYNQNSFALCDLFLEKQQGVLTACDDLVVDTNKERLELKIKLYQDVGQLPISIEKSKETKRSAKYHLKNLKNKKGKIKLFPYRPFDIRVLYDSDMVLFKKKELTQHEQVHENIYFNFTPNCWDKNNYSHILISKNTPCNHLFAHGTTYTAPLYLHSPNVIDPSAPQFTSNLNTTITAKFTSLESTITDLDIVDYIYGVLNDKAYTTKYNQFLKSNYPKVPYPKDIDTFNTYKDAGSKLRQVHLDDNTQDAQSTYNATTNNKIEKVSFDADKVYFNKSSYFDNISQEMWDFKIGASQPLKNWLESRKEDTFDQTMIEQYLNVVYKVRNSL